MTTPIRSDWDGRRELAELREQLREHQETIDVIRSGTIDSLIIGRPGEEKVYSLLTADRSYRLIVEGMNEGAAIVSDTGIILHANPHLGQMLGRPCTELIGGRASELVTPSFAAVWSGLVNIGHDESARAEVDLTVAGGIPLPVVVSASGLSLDDTLLCCLIITDLTASRQAKAELSSANDDLRVQAAELSRARDDAQSATLEATAATRAKSAFLAAMSHEIRTPMHAVISLTGLLLDTALDTTQRDYLETVNSSGDALLAIINDVLDYSKIESGAMNLEVEPFDVRDLLESVVDQVWPQAQSKRLRLLVDIGTGCPRSLVGDVTRLRQVLLNLMGNAVKFTSSGEVVTTLRTEETAAGQLEMHVAVRDSGIGIRAGDMDRLFRAFSQVEPSTTRLYGGTGLGLAISARLVEAMGGQIGVSSEPGRGSTFRFDIPTARPDGPDGTRSDDLAGLCVLVVDDNGTSRQILQRQIEIWGSASVAAGTVSEALVQAGRQAFDIAIIDGDLTAAERDDFCRLLHEQPGCARLPLVLLNVEAGRSEAANQAFCTALVEPVKLARLAGAMVAGLDRGSMATTAVSTRSDLDAGAGMRVLVVEDNLVNQKIALLMLERVGCRADVAGNGFEALAALRLSAYDLVFMDVQMPQMDGLEATRQIRTAFPHRQPTIIGMTANALSEDRHDCLQAGMDDYLTKPFRLEHLVAILAKWRPLLSTR